MNELLTQIQDVYAAFSTDVALQIEKNNKAAGTRARKASLELEKFDEGVPQALSGRVQKIISSFLIIFTCSCGMSVCEKPLLF